MWENPHIASICSEMTNMTILQANAAAALDRTELSFQDRQLLKSHARASAPAYCAGCGNVCESVLKADVPISDIMRYLMYHDEYGEQHRAMQLYRELPPVMRKQLASFDYAKAEQLCPQKMPIAQLMHRATEVLSGDLA